MYEFTSDEQDKQPVSTNDLHWFPVLEEYDPGISTEKWLELLTDKSIIGGDYVWARALAVFYVENEDAVPSVLNSKYGYNGSLLQYCTNIAKYVRNLTNCPLTEKKNIG